MMGSVLVGLGVGTPEEETQGGGLWGHHDQQQGHAEGQQGRLSASQENLIKNISNKKQNLHYVYGYGCGLSFKTLSQSYDFKEEESSGLFEAGTLEQVFTEHFS